MNVIYLEQEFLEECSKDTEDCFVMQVSKTPDALGSLSSGPYVNLNWFLKTINSMAEDRMIKTGVLEGAHFNAMKSFAATIEGGIK